MNQPAPTEWLRSFVPLGWARGDAWTPLGGGVLVLDLPFVWLVTAAAVVQKAGERHLLAWLPGRTRPQLLDLTQSLQTLGLGWIQHAQEDLAATLLPIDPKFDVRAFGPGQCTRIAEVPFLQPVVTLGALYSPEIPSAGQPALAMLDGLVARADEGTRRLYTTATLLPRNQGAPLLLASAHGGPATLAGILTGNVTLPEADPRELPTRLGCAIAIDAALELLAGDAANQLRQRARDGAPSERRPDA